MEIREIIFGIITTLLGSSVLNSYFNRRWEHTDKSSNILEEQYLKVIAPIYRELKLNTKEDVISNIGNIIYENFYLLPEQLFEKYQNITDNKKDFETLVFNLYTILRNKLGYSKVKVSKEIKATEKLLAASKIMTVIDFIVLTVVSLLGFLSLVLTIYAFYLSIRMKNTGYIITCSILLILCLVLFISPIKTLAKNYFSVLQKNSNNG